MRVCVYIYMVLYHLSEVNLTEYILSEFKNHFQFQFNIFLYILYLFILG